MSPAEDRRRGAPGLLALTLLAAAPVAVQAGCDSQLASMAPPHNVILFVADGLRPGVVNPVDTPAIYGVRTNGTYFANSHSLFPTFTMANASALATGYDLGATGIYGNALYVGFPVQAAATNPAPFLESDPVLGEIREHLGGSPFGTPTLIEMARQAGLATASIGKLGPTLLADVTAGGTDTVVIDDSTGSAPGLQLSSELTMRLQAAGLPLATPGRGDNGRRGDFMTPGTTVANTVQQQYFLDVTTEVLLPWFKDRGQGFFLVYWSRDPDGTQHNQGDSLGSLKPGIDGPTSRAALRNADDNLATIRQTLRKLDLENSTNVVVTSDHGFYTISKQGTGSFAAAQSYPDVPAGLLPPGFLAIDLSHELGLPLYDGEALLPTPTAMDATMGQHPKSGTGLLGTDPTRPQVIVAANGGADFIYLPAGSSVQAGAIVNFLLDRDYVSGVFVDEKLGSFPGALGLGDIGLGGDPKLPRPAIVTSFRSGDTGCGDATACGWAITDWYLQQGQGMHGSFARSDTLNMMAAFGPDFRPAFTDPAPASNADLAATLATVLRLPGGPAEGRGRVLGEALQGQQARSAPVTLTGTLQSAPGTGGLRTVVRYQEAGGMRYFDAGGFPGRTNGL